MKMLDLLQTLLPLTHQIPEALRNCDIQAIVYDSRKLVPGSLYVPLPGTQLDGHQFIPQVFQQGARAALCQLEKRDAFQEFSQYLIPVKDTRHALAEISAAFWGHPAKKMTMIGVTGTNGKTTITSFLNALLNHFAGPCGWVGTLGAGFQAQTLEGEFTTPFPPELQAWLAQMQSADTRYVAMECSSHALEQQRLGAIRFDYGIFTNLTQDHLDYHGSMEAYAQAKSLLFSHALKPEGLAILNRDDPAYEYMANASRAQSLSFGFDARADLYAKAIQLNPEGASFTLCWKNKDYLVQAPLSGRHNISNLLASLAVLLHLGVPPERLMAFLTHLPAVPGRMQRVSPDGHPYAVYVDYAHTPDSLEHALKTLRELSPGRLRLVFGCGGDRDKGKRPLMGQIAQSLADDCIVTSDNPRTEIPETIVQDILAGMSPGPDVRSELDRKRAIEMALSQAQAGDCILVAGKGHETYQIIGQQRLHFDDREIVQNFIRGDLC